MFAGRHDDGANDFSLATERHWHTVAVVSVRSIVGNKGTCEQCCIIRELISAFISQNRQLSRKTTSLVNTTMMTTMTTITTTNDAPFTVLLVARSMKLCASMRLLSLLTLSRVCAVWWLPARTTTMTNRRMSGCRRVRVAYEAVVEQRVHTLRWNHLDQQRFRLRTHPLWRSLPRSHTPSRNDDTPVSVGSSSTMRAHTKPVFFLCYGERVTLRMASTQRSRTCALNIVRE
jgi:hypothetical protein